MGFVKNTIGSITGSSQAKAASEARDAQVSSTREAIEAQEEAAKRARKELEPFQAEDRQAALDRLRAFSGALGEEAQRQAFASFVESPQTEFLRREGLRGIERNLSARGGLGGGSRLRAISEFNQQLASESLGSQLSQLGTIAQQDLATAGNLANIELGLGAQQAAGLQNIGATLASGILAKAQARAQGAKNILGLAGAATGAAVGGAGGLSGIGISGGAGGALQGAQLGGSIFGG